MIGDGAGPLALGVRGVGARRDDRPEVDVEPRRRLAERRDLDGEAIELAADLVDLVVQASAAVVETLFDASDRLL